MRKRKLEKNTNAIENHQSFLEEFEHTHQLENYYKDFSMGEFLAKLIKGEDSVQESKTIDGWIKLSKRLHNIKIENLVLVFCSFLVSAEFFFFIKKYKDKGVLLFRGKKENIVFYRCFENLLKHKITDKAIEQQIGDKIDLIESFCEMDLMYFIDNPIFKEIDSYLHNLEQNLPADNYNFIKQINIIDFGNTFKLYYLMKESGLQSKLQDEVKSIDILPKLQKDRDIKHINDTITKIEEELLSDNEMDVLGLDEEELIEFKKETYNLGANISPEYILLNLKDSISFNKKNIKGLASILYDLFVIIFDKDEDYDDDYNDDDEYKKQFLSSDEWFSREGTNYYRRSLKSRDWRIYQKNQVSKIINTELFFK